MWNCHELLALSQLVGKVNAYGNDSTDEFSVERDGGRQGIFKAWAIPAIPFLDFGNIEVLVKLWPDLIVLADTIGFWQALTMLADGGNEITRDLALTAVKTLSDWNRVSVDKPSYLERSLERARINSWILDLRLTNVFNRVQLASDMRERINQLVNRLELSFSLLAPFYNLEALAGDPKWIYGQREPAKRHPSCGKLDAIALLLPSAMSDFVTATRLNWHGLSWEDIRRTTQELLSDDALQSVILNISRVAGIPPHHVLFAANSLEWIPIRGGGKKEDMAPRDATEQIADIISGNEPASRDKNAADVLSNANAMIRFQNWVPLIEGDRNFEGLDWTYSSVCDTSNALLDTLNHGSVWSSDFRPTFEQKLRCQLDDLDATSAKGRFLLQLIREGRLESKLAPRCDYEWKMKTIRELQESSFTMVNAGRTIWPRSVVGDKTFGLSLASFVLEEEHILNYFAITSDEVESWLRVVPEIWRNILWLNQEHNLDSKVSIAESVERAIVSTELPEWLSRVIAKRVEALPREQSWAIRSSSLEEGEARGVYSSYLQVPGGEIKEAVKGCIASFYSKEAVLFRSTSQSGDLPFFAVLVMPYRKGAGGVVARARQAGSHEIIVEAGSSADEVTSNGCEAKAISCSHPLSAEATRVFSRLERVFGRVQIEWVRSNRNLRLLQLDLLENDLSDIGGTKQCDFAVSIDSLDELRLIERDLESREGNAAIVLGPMIELDLFQGELLGLIARFGRRICEVRADGRVLETSHFANICGHFRIALS